MNISPLRRLVNHFINHFHLITNTISKLWFFGFWFFNRQKSKCANRKKLSHNLYNNLKLMKLNIIFVLTGCIIGLEWSKKEIRVNRLVFYHCSWNWKVCSQSNFYHRCNVNAQVMTACIPNSTTTYFKVKKLHWQYAHGLGWFHVTGANVFSIYKCIVAVMCKCSKVQSKYIKILGLFRLILIRTLFL